MLSRYITKASTHRAEIFLLILAFLFAILSALSNIFRLLIIFAPILLVSIIFIWKKPLIATTILLVLMPFHSLAMRIIQVELDLSDSILLVLSMWKEFVLLILVLRAITLSKISKKIGLLDALIILFIFFNFIYVFVADRLGDGLYGFRGTIEPFAFYLVGKKLPFSSERLSKIFKYLLIAAVIVSIFGVIQAHVLGMPFLLKYRAENNVLATSHIANIGGIKVVRASSTFSSPNDVGMYLVILLLIAIGIQTRKRFTLMEIVALAFLLLGMLLTLSRSSWFAFFMGMVFMVVVRKKISKRLFMAAVVLTLISLPVIIQMNIVTRITEALTLSDPSAAGRIPSILNGINFVLQNPFGIGTGMAGPRSLRFNETLKYHSENFYVLMAMEIGILGLLIYMALIWVVILMLYRTYCRRQDIWRRGLAFGTLLAVVGVSFGVIFIPSLQEITVASLLWFFIGASISTLQPSTNSFQVKFPEMNQS